MKYEIGFIGCGNMGGALARAVAKTLDHAQILLCDQNAEKAAALAAELGAKTADIREVAENCRFVVLGVKPQVLGETLAGVRSILQDRTDLTLISMAAGTSTEKITEYLGFSCSIIRIMPNTPAAIGEGVILYSVSGASQAAVSDFCTCFAQAGLLDEIEENRIDAASALSGCGPAFAYIFTEALADAAVECGLPRDKALLYAAQTLRGAACMVEEYGNPAALKDAVCSPGGTTIAGVHALESAGFRAAAMNAVTAAYRRTLELAGKK